MEMLSIATQEAPSREPTPRRSSPREDVWEALRTARVAWDLFVEWDPNDPRARVSPDVLLLDGQPPDIKPSIWQTWKPGCEPPPFALEIVSEKSTAKDYDLSPPRHSR